MDTFYFKTDRLLIKFIFWLLFSLLFIGKLSLSATSINDYVLITFLTIAAGFILFFLGRQLIAAIQKQPALIITDESVFVFESRNTLTFYLSNTYYWDDIQFFRKRIHSFSSSIELGFNGPDSEDPIIIHSVKNWFTRCLCVSFNISVIDANGVDILNSLERHSTIIEG